MDRNDGKTYQNLFKYHQLFYNNKRARQRECISFCIISSFKESELNLKNSHVTVTE